MRGNTNCSPDNVIDVSDLMLLIDYMFITFDPLCCHDAGNIDGDAVGEIDITDLTILIDYMFISFTPPDTCGPGTLTYLQRQAMFESLDSLKTDISNLPKDSQAMSIAAFLNSRPEIDSAGVTDGISVWAWFIDGWILSIPNNRDPSPGTNELVVSVPELFDNDVPNDFVLPERRFPHLEDPTLQAELGPMPSMSTSNFELPSSIQCRVTSTLSKPPFDPIASTIKTRLENNGYVSVPFSGTVAQLLNVQDDGVFYMDAHGGSFPDRMGTMHLGVWTANVQSAANDRAFRSLLNRNELVLMEAKDLNPTTGVVEDHWRYGFTGKFVAQYMYFVPNSFVFMNACQTDSIASLRQGFFTAGASVYGGWSKVVNDPAANKAADFLFDRLLGSNASTLVPKESPPQRPFDVDPLWQDMKNRGFDTDPDAPNAKFRIRRLQGSFGLLAPSLRYMAVVEHFDTLYVTGMFGTDPGPNRRRVIVGGTDMLVYDWQPQLITCFIPNTGAGSVGPVTVEVDGLTGPSSSTKRMSNVVNLTEWHGQFTYKRDDFDSLTGTIVIDARLRADIHKFRDYPHETPKFYSVVFPAKESSYGVATVSGNASYTEPGSDPPNVTHWHWHGSHNLVGLWENDPAGFLLTGYVNGNLRQFRLHVVAAEARGLTETISWDGGQEDYAISVDLPYELYDEFPGYFYTGMSNVWDILAGSRTVMLCCSRDPGNIEFLPDVIHTFSWPTIPASFAPDPNAAQ